MDFRILGPLEALDEGRGIALGGSKQRALLALLLLHANETLSSDRLIEELWGEHPPATAPKTVQVHVSRLRKALGTGGMVVTRQHGYELQVDPESVDAGRFERLVAEGRSELAAGAPERAAATLEEALSLWRGPPLDEFAYEPFAQHEIARLDELRLTALEQQIEAKLALGRQAEVVSQLEALIADHPYRENLRALLMLALYRSDRQADALQAYQHARRALVEELGIEPGERLRELERAVLAQEPGLALPAEPPRARETEAEPGAPPEAEVRAELPSGVVTFLLTDIEGSSALWEADAEAMADALERHDDLIGTSAAKHGGLLLKSKGEGDATLTVFPRASDAVACAVELQRALAATDWPGGLSLRVRVALHTGEAQERGGDYFGPALNRAARLKGLVRGGATVVSHATAEIVQDRLPGGVELVELGPQQLRGLRRPENAFELRDTVPTALASREARKTVSVVFAGVAGDDPELGRLDPEARRRLVSRCLTAAREALEHHGASVQAYPGDSLMAVFGVPLLHEDDALRAVRAAVEVRDAMAAGEDDIERDFGVRIGAKAGVGTGEVIVGAEDGEPAVTAGDAVNAARRLEQLAAAGEVLIDEETHARVRAFVDTASAGNRAALRLVSVRGDVSSRAPRLISPLVGRGRELAALSARFEDAVRDRTCQLVTLLGAAGVGKSRLAEEFIGGLGEEARVLRGRCLSYGDGATYWPLAELVRDMTGEPSLGAIGREIADEPNATEIVMGVGEAIGLSESRGATSEKTFWAARRLLESLARDRPLVVVLDDLQWAEPTFLDLVEYVADLSRGAPIVLLCLARPELLETRQGWGGGKLNASSTLLQPLSAEDTRQLVAELLAVERRDAEAAARIAEAAEGNPLFVEELLAMVIEDGLLLHDGEQWTVTGDLSDLRVPPTIHALLAARLDRLAEPERELLALGSVEGVVFHRSALLELVPDTRRARVDQRLTALVQRELVRPDRPSFAGDYALRFRHALIRDAAYRSLPKGLRAQLHAQFAAWLERTAGDRLNEFEEIVGYHLEQAHALLAELGPLDADAERLAVRGGERLESAGRRALGRNDLPGAINLLERAAALLAGDERRRSRLLPDLGAALLEAGRLTDADRVLVDAGAAAAAAGDECAAARTLVQQQFVRLQRGESRDTAEAAAVVERVLPVLTEHGDEHGLVGALRLRAWLHWIPGHAQAAAEAWEQAAAHARGSGADHERNEILGWVASAMFFGPVPVPDAVRRCEAMGEEVSGDPAAVAHTRQPLAGLHAMEGRFEVARELLVESNAVFEELGMTLSSAVSHHAATVEMLAGDAAAAEVTLRNSYATLVGMGETSFLSTTAAYLAAALFAQGRHDEADRFAEESERLAAEDDVLTQVLWRGVRARTLALRGSFGEAERLAWHAVLMSEDSDFLNHRAAALVDLAIVLHQAGRADEAQTAFADGLRLFEQKGNTVAADRARADIATAERV